MYLKKKRNSDSLKNSFKKSEENRIPPVKTNLKGKK